MKQKGPAKTTNTKPVCKQNTPIATAIRDANAFTRGFASSVLSKMDHLELVKDPWDDARAVEVLKEDISIRKDLTSLYYQNLPHLETLSSAMGPDSLLDHLLTKEAEWTREHGVVDEVTPPPIPGTDADGAPTRSNGGGSIRSAHDIVRITLKLQRAGMDAVQAGEPDDALFANEKLKAMEGENNLMLQRINVLKSNLEESKRLRRDLQRENSALLQNITNLQVRPRDRVPLRRTATRPLATSTSGAPGGSNGSNGKSKRWRLANDE